MSTYTRILYQIVFSTRNREDTIEITNCKDLYKYIWGVLKNNRCHLYQIGGTTNHIHLITHLHPSVALADLIKDIKLSSTAYIKNQKFFPRFNGWQEGYGSFTYTIDAKDKLIHYVKHQEVHHQHKTYLEELKELLREHSIEYNEQYLI